MENLALQVEFLENEVWKQIDGFDGYQVSNFGRIKSARKILKTDKKIGKNGYMNCSLGRNKTRMIHRLVASQFLGYPPTTRHQVNHKNGNKLDNRVENLEWVTPKQNIKHAKKIGLLDSHSIRFKTKYLGTNNPNAKLTHEDIQWLVWSLKHTTLFLKEIAACFNISKSTVQRYASAHKISRSCLLRDKISKNKKTDLYGRFKSH